MKTFQFFIAAVLVLLCSCKKYLDAKPDKTVAIPTTINDCQLILDSYANMNMVYPSAAEVQSDNYYLIATHISALLDFDRSTYLWNKFPIIDNNNWAYRPIYIANIALDALAEIKVNPGDEAQFHNAKGSGLFFRAYYMHAIAQIFAPAYEQSTAATDLGIPIRLTSDFGPVSVRATMQETYNQIIKDLKTAAAILPINPVVKSRPSKPAAFGALARVYLSMQDYTNAGLYADSCLLLTSDLLDFNTLSTTAAAPIARFNKEVVFHVRSPNATCLAPARAKIDSTLYNSFDANDLRKVIYFKSNNNGTFAFKGDYDGSGTSSGFVFGGIVTDEMYLIRAESKARQNKISEALSDLNTLLKTRWKKNTFVDFAANTSAEALGLILAERRKELFFRGTRWTDLRRLMKDPAFTTTPKRIYNTTEYALPPNSPRYLMLIPTDVIKLSGMPQNP